MSFRSKDERKRERRTVNQARISRVAVDFELDLPLLDSRPEERGEVRGQGSKLMGRKRTLHPARFRPTRIHQPIDKGPETVDVSRDELKQLLRALSSLFAEKV